MPFTTSTLQQEASKALNFSTSKTMRLAQQLYEGVEIKGSGTVGLITYLRTDSTRVSEEAKQNAKEYIERVYGSQYGEETETVKKSQGKIQDAHEAIRPTDISRTPLEMKESLSRDLFRLYQLIWKRFTASCMKPAVYETTSVKIDAKDYRFNVSASKIIFDGFMSVYTEADEEKGKEACWQSPFMKIQNSNWKALSQSSTLPSPLLIIRRLPLCAHWKNWALAVQAPMPPRLALF